MKHICILWPPFEAVLSILNFSLPFKTILKKELIKTKETHHQPIIRFLKMSVLEDRFGSSVDLDVADSLYLINIYTYTNI